MNVYIPEGDKTHLGFRLPGPVSVDKETELVKKFLLDKGVEIGKSEMMPYCDIYKCKLGGLGFELCVDLDYGCTILADEDTAATLEKLLSEA
ncbi:MAG: hypothetical protein K6A90_08570 [Lachnospiraceae bacterium]|nr:hypothetical protein [Lachnospiraceae bacterium]